MAKTKTDLYGKFAFAHVPLEPTIVYLPGADRDGVHYPGQRVRLDPRNPIGHVTLVVFDAVKAPSPLLATRHDIDVHVEQHVMEITETLVVTNRSRATYVGQPVGDMPPVTLRLSIPENFDRVTFGSEFHGRRFLIVDHRVVTDIPWPPGDGELKFTYRVPLEGSAGLFRRPLDLPSSNVRIRVRAKDAQQVSCNLSAIDRCWRPRGLCSGRQTTTGGLRHRTANRKRADSLDAVRALEFVECALCADSRDGCGTPAARPANN